MTSVLQVKNGIIKLPKKFQKVWENAFVFEPSPGTLVIKKIERSAGKLSRIASKIKSRPLSASTIRKEIAAYRKST